VFEAVNWQHRAVLPPAASRSHPDDPRQYTVEFLPDSTLAIQAECNRATGNFILTGS